MILGVPLERAEIWQECLDHLQADITPQEFNTWIRPLQPVVDASGLRLLAPNQYVVSHINLFRVRESLRKCIGQEAHA